MVACCLPPTCSSPGSRFPGPKTRARPAPALMTLMRFWWCHWLVLLSACLPALRNWMLSHSHDHSLSLSFSCCLCICVVPHCVCAICKQAEWGSSSKTCLNFWHAQLTCPKLIIMALIMQSHEWRKGRGEDGSSQRCPCLSSILIMLLPCRLLLMLLYPVAQHPAMFLWYALLSLSHILMRNFGKHTN